MTDPSITLRPAETEDLDRVGTLLDANALPSEDVGEKPECFFVATAETEFVGAGGVEIYGSNGLLRSVVVDESSRGQGYGTALCDRLEDYARKQGVESLSLLTTTATAFFRERGYGETRRESVPSSVRQTTQFAALCPDSATCLVKTLQR